MKHYILATAIVLLLLPESIIIRDRHHNGDFSGIEKKGATSLISAFATAAADEEAERKFQALFISDLKRLLEHNRWFYNTYGAQDPDVDWAFDSAKIAADIIYLHPQIFQEKIKLINYKIEEALLKKKMQEMEDAPALTADGKPVYFVDKGLLLIGTLGGMGIIRFPNN